ncbi:Acetyltransferase (GNAT) family protein [Novipirellula galeiformis]|uniref:Acetyltransferase (GNAT) family protein n=1 Tax=Novipirellula galeiformis TaxID=2528004 RepID=A0A5C6BS03_9BACT|nr:GNAT family N-acetyltransferase [Novipirellula galeiformis]TWU15033.1 Acetyltransferase (GNAT) family protein [Novipirellula galeiformis]
MSKIQIETPRLKLALQSLDETRARIDAMSETDKVNLSADWLSLLGSATSADPWLLGFNIQLRDSNVFVGQCGFKGPPTPEGVVEIAYCVEPDRQRNGYATEAARALVHYAFGHNEVLLVRAHTLPETNASTRVLTRCGFRNMGEVIDPDDGPVWRWEIQRESA